MSSTSTRPSVAGGSPISPRCWGVCVERGASSSPVHAQGLHPSQAAVFAHMLAEAGAPVSGTPVPQADPAAFEAWLVEGYEAVAGAGAVDRARLDRMVAMRREFYDRFARRALDEGVPEDLAQHMVPFLEYTLRWTTGRTGGPGKGATIP